MKVEVYLALVFVVIMLAYVEKGNGDGIFYYVDSKGVIHFTDTPTNLKKYKPFIPIEKAKKIIHQAHRKLSLNENRYDPIIRIYSKEFSIPFELIKAVIKAESNFNPYAVSPAGAVGLMQLMPETARKIGVTNLWSPVENIYAGVRYLRYLLDKFSWNYSKALAAYNAGSLRVLKNGGVPDIPETKNYIRKVFYYYRIYIARSLAHLVKK